jgi:Family of unknown function (DUF6064)
MPFTREQFFDVFAAWNGFVWPVQIVAYILGLAALILVFRSSRGSTVAVLMILAIMWVTNGAGYHWSFFSEINPAAWIFGAAFVLEAIFFVAAIFAAPHFRISATRDASTVLGLALALYALLLYPLLGWVFGHRYPAVPMFGIAPCPTTIFTIGLLMLGSWRTARWLLMIPGLWGVVGGSAAILLGVPQDYGLILATLLALGIAIARFAGAGFARHEIGLA